MNTISTQLRRRILELCILKIISRGEVYLSDMLEELKEAELISAEGTLYPLMYRFRKANLVLVRSENLDSGPTKKYYTLSAEGLVAIAQLEQTWLGLVNSVQMITSKQPTS
ncbi:PadR family transcriptional regulator [Mongoliitalea daihaiensis]|uniref:PadR family transcriptional regulator n=1 Tax=Mongoliitalea daihaiensis TaxID=2782006 RepID=UPI001F2A691E|nr:PadR family transcriptional regulator [Mongoliitalea daihaiensis]UJP65012.1 PadR family transcriptional regulator [Mongoliitalea daihaiensis]